MPEPEYGLGFLDINRHLMRIRIPAIRQHALLDRLGKQPRHNAAHGIPARALAEDVTPIAAHMRQQRLDVHARHILEVHGRGRDGVEPLAQRDAQDQGVGALEGLARAQRQLVAALDERRVQVDDVELGLVLADPPLGLGERGDLGGCVGRELALVRRRGEGHAVRGLGWAVLTLAAVELGYWNQRGDG